MGRKKTLTTDQISEIERRIVNGESRRKLAEEFKVSEAAIRRYVTTRPDEIKKVANQILVTEKDFASLPISSQIVALNLADELRAISSHMAGAGKKAAMLSHRLIGLAHIESDKIDSADIGASMETIKAVSALTKMANDAADIPLGLMAANKDRVPIEDQDDKGYIVSPAQALTMESWVATAKISQLEEE